MKFAFLSFLLVALYKEKTFKVDAAVFDMHLDSIGYVRTDPILDSQCLSDHVHAFYGAKALFPSTTFADLRNVDPYEVSGNILENKSLYWHPAVYRELSDGTYELQETRLGVYYIWDPTDPNVRAFTPDFAMIAGGSKIDSKAELNFECESTGAASSIFPIAACTGEDAEFFIEFKMPNCWNGDQRDSQDSHVAYSENGTNEKDDPCPVGFQKIPQLWLFIEFPNQYQGGNHIFADGTQVLHVDYFNGWDETELSSALVNCVENADEFSPIGGSRCPQFNYKNDILGLGEDVEYTPSQPFPTNLITNEVITGEKSLPRGSAKNSDGTCATSDQPKEGGSGGPATPMTSAPAAPTDAPVTPTDAPAAPTTDTPVAPTAAPATPTDVPAAPTTNAPVSPPTDSPIVEGNEEDCEDNCLEGFFVCEDNADELCDESLSIHDCVADCEEFHDSDEDAIYECIEEECECVEDWCTEDQDLCYEIEDERCRRQRRRCIRGCEE